MVDNAGRDFRSIKSWWIMLGVISGRTTWSKPQPPDAPAAAAVSAQLRLPAAHGAALYWPAQEVPAAGGRHRLRVQRALQGNAIQSFVVVLLRTRADFGIGLVTILQKRCVGISSCDMSVSGMVWGWCMSFWNFNITDVSSIFAAMLISAAMFVMMLHVACCSYYLLLAGHW